MAPVVTLVTNLVMSRMRKVGRVSTCGTRCATLVTNLVTSQMRKVGRVNTCGTRKYWIVITTDRTYAWSFVTDTL